MLRGRAPLLPSLLVLLTLLVESQGWGFFHRPGGAYPAGSSRPGPGAELRARPGMRRNRRNVPSHECQTMSTTASSSSATSTTSADKHLKLVGAQKFVRHNPRSDRFDVVGFHHIEFYCGDATNTCRRFQQGLGMNVVGKSDLSTGNTACASYVLQSGQVRFIFTAPYAVELGGNGGEGRRGALPGYDARYASDFFVKHGLAARAIGIEVSDATIAYEQCIGHGGQTALPPTRMVSPDNPDGPGVVVAEVRAYGDVVLRFISKEPGYTGDDLLLPTYKRTPSPKTPLDFGIERLDHAVGNVWDLLEAVNYLSRMTGFHEFAEFTAGDVGTADSGLNSMVLASNDEMVLMPVNEPTYGTKRKSQIQTYLEFNNGPGLQHLALYTSDIFTTMKKLREMEEYGGFELQERPMDTYYQELPKRIGDSLTPEQYKLVEELGLLVDKDDQGVLLQIFTKPVGDRPTLFLEIIQRVGCLEDSPDGKGKVQRGGCGGFGKGNFHALFKSIEEYEKKLKLN